MKFSQRISTKKETVTEKRMRTKDTEAAMLNCSRTSTENVIPEGNEQMVDEDEEEGEDDQDEDDDEDIFNVIQQNIARQPARNVNDI